LKAGQDIGPKKTRELELEASAHDNRQTAILGVAGTISLARKMRSGVEQASPSAEHGRGLAW